MILVSGISTQVPIDRSDFNTSSLTNIVRDQSVPG